MNYFLSPVTLSAILILILVVLCSLSQQEIVTSFANDVHYYHRTEVSHELVKQN
jgi:hypothetical protein